MYIISYDKGKGYFQQVKYNHWTTDIEKANKFKNLTAAKNTIAAASAQSDIKTKLDKIEYIEYQEPVKSFNQYTPEEADAIFSDFERCVNELRILCKTHLPSLQHYYCELESNQNKLQEDLLHKFELMSSSNLQLVRYGRKLQECRRIRREAKNKTSFLTCVQDSNIKDLYDEIETYYSFKAASEYVPRVAPELFE